MGKHALSKQLSYGGKRAALSREGDAGLEITNGEEGGQGCGVAAPRAFTPHLRLFADFPALRRPRWGCLTFRPRHAALCGGSERFNYSPSSDGAARGPSQRTSTNKAGAATTSPGHPKPRIRLSQTTRRGRDRTAPQPAARQRRPAPLRATQRPSEPDGRGPPPPYPPYRPQNGQNRPPPASRASQPPGEARDRYLRRAPGAVAAGPLGAAASALPAVQRNAAQPLPAPGRPASARPETARGGRRPVTEALASLPGTGPATERKGAAGRREKEAGAEGER